MQPRTRNLLLAALAVVGLAYVGRAALTSQAPATPDARVTGGARDPDAARSEAVADAVQRALAPPPEPQMRLPPGAARKAAEASFEAMMATLEELADAGDKVPKARREQLYRNTNDAFAALSAELDAHDETDRQTLEDANIRMKAMLQELGVRVPKRPLPLE